MKPATSSITPPLMTPRELLRELLRGIAVCTGIGLFLTVLQGGQGLFESLVYSHTIGLSCGSLINYGIRALTRRLARRSGQEPADPRWPGWPGMIAVLILGTLIGYTIGVALGNAITGYTLPFPWQISSGRSIGTLTFSVTIGAVATTIFWLRGRLSAEQARAEAAQRVAAQTQLKLLESQLEPHMLFNTLANLRVLIALDPPRAQAMLDRLIAFLRATLAASRSESHSLASEFERIADYLALMQVRMGEERLQVALDLPGELATQPVPPLLLQPLVENAIQHGLEPSRAGGRLSVGARRDGNALLLTVRDTGVGFDAERKPAEGHGFGTHQVRERLATLYGERARFTLAAATDGGTLATISLPLD